MTVPWVLRPDSGTFKGLSAVKKHQNLAVSLALKADQLLVRSTIYSMRYKSEYSVSCRKPSQEYFVSFSSKSDPVFFLDGLGRTFGKASNTTVAAAETKSLFPSPAPPPLPAKRYSSQEMQARKTNTAAPHRTTPHRTARRRGANSVFRYLFIHIRSRRPIFWRVKGTPLAEYAFGIEFGGNTIAAAAAEIKSNERGRTSFRRYQECSYKKELGVRTQCEAP